ncbi:MAG TPA: DUF6600 domain-containing protein [Candidatus Acidoferrales bacterium]|nr:DUF6600 domain-containing protein [Candidatus Acidoferrales bacterium]
MRLTKSNRTSYFLLSFMACALFLVLPGVTAGQDDPPIRVARLNFLQGSVSLQPAGTEDWVEANPNRPLTTGDQLWIDEGARAELHLGSTAIRVSETTGISFLNVGDQAVQIQVAQGSADFRILHMWESEIYEIDTANLAFTITRPGEYRVDVNPDGTQTLVTVRDGAGEVTAGGQTYELVGGQQYAFQGTDQINYSADYVPDPDDFDSWCTDRDHREDNAMSARYISREVIGYEDLDAYGSWHTDSTYGPVWVPTGVAADWAPYHTGHWAFVGPWGWTWVDDAPWGFAPFHYGRWAYVGGGWGWVPGPVAIVGPRPGVVVVAGGWGVRPVYAPALVGFVGGGGFSASIAIGGGVAGVAWVPLGPRDVWVPGYRTSAAYMTNVNVTSTTVINRTEITNVYNTTIVNNTTNVTKITYSNQTAPGAVTAVPQKAFQGGQPVAAASVKVSAEEVSSPKVISAKPVAPTAQSVRGPAPAAPASARPPAALASHPVVTKMAPSPKAIPVGHSAPLTPASYKPATKPNAHPNTSVKPATRPTIAAKPAGAPGGKPANSPAGKPANAATAPPAHNASNPSPAEQPKKVNPPAGNPNKDAGAKPNPDTERGTNGATQPPKKFTPPPSHENTNSHEEAAKPPAPAKQPPAVKPPPPAAPKPDAAAKPPAAEKPAAKPAEAPKKPATEAQAPPKNQNKEPKKDDKKPAKDPKEQEKHPEKQ